MPWFKCPEFTSASRGCQQIPRAPQKAASCVRRARPFTEFFLPPLPPLWPPRGQHRCGEGYRLWHGTPSARTWGPGRACDSAPETGWARLDLPPPGGPGQNLLRGHRGPWENEKPASESRRRPSLETAWLNVTPPSFLVRECSHVSEATLWPTQWSLSSHP